MTINNFTELYRRTVEPGHLISSFVSGHLVIEFLLRKLIQIYDPALSKLADSITHARLIELNYEIGTINQNQRDVLVLVNKMRNKFAHQLTYKPSLEELTKLFTEASKAFSDMTDGISQGLDAMSTAKSVGDLDEWVVSELFVQLSYDLHEEYQSRGGDIEDF